MNPSRTTLYMILGGILIVLIGGGLLWYILQPTTTNTAPPTPTTEFGTAQNTNTSVVKNTPTDTEAPLTTTAATDKIFTLANGPIAGVTIIQTLHPTTTIARYVTQDTGHVMDITIDSPGTVARAVSNTTIPGIVKVLWVEGGAAAILQYMDQQVVKTLYIHFPGATATSTTAATANKIKFFPDNIADIAVSPDGSGSTYLLLTSGGVDGYVAKADGSSGKKLFSLPLSEVLISWPSATTILAQTKSTSGVQGLLFSIDSRTGSVVPLLSAPGLTVNADKSFTHILYQSSGGASPTTYVRNVKKGTDRKISFSPFPEKCVWSSGYSVLFYCATATSYLDPTYLDLWHQGAASAADSIMVFNSVTGHSSILATPGVDGGEASDIATLAASPDDHYIAFINRGSHILWGARLTQ